MWGKKYPDIKKKYPDIVSYQLMCTVPFFLGTVDLLPFLKNVVTAKTGTRKWSNESFN